MGDFPPKMSRFRVLILGTGLIAVGTLGFAEIPGMIDEYAKGSRWVNAFYCAVITLTTVGYGDICPGNISTGGKLFIVAFVVSGLGFFSGPVMNLASSWRGMVPGGNASIIGLTLAVGATIFTKLEGVAPLDAIYASIVTGTTIGFGDFTPSTDVGKLMVALYAMAAINVLASILQPARDIFENLCTVPDDSLKPETLKKELKSE